METYLTPDEVAKKLNITVQTILRYIRTKKLRAVRLGKGYRLSEKDIKAFIEERQTI